MKKWWDWNSAMKLLLHWNKFGQRVAKKSCWIPCRWVSTINFHFCIILSDTDVISQPMYIGWNYLLLSFYPFVCYFCFNSIRMNLWRTKTIHKNILIKFSQFCFFKFRHGDAEIWDMNQFVTESFCIRYNHHWTIIWSFHFIISTAIILITFEKVSNGIMNKFSNRIPQVGMFPLPRIKGNYVFQCLSFSMNSVENASLQKMLWQLRIDLFELQRRFPIICSNDSCLVYRR